MKYEISVFLVITAIEKKNIIKPKMIPFEKYEILKLCAFHQD